MLCCERTATDQAILCYQASGTTTMLLSHSSECSKRITHSLTHSLCMHGNYNDIDTQQTDIRLLYNSCYK